MKNLVMKNQREIFSFGKHKGETILEVIEEDAQYILWLSHNGICKFSSRILNKAKQQEKLQVSDFYYENYDIGDLEF